MEIQDKTKKRLYNYLIVPLVMLISGGIRAIVVHMFVVPYDFAMSGFAGIAVIIQRATGNAFNAGYTLLILNFPLLVLSWIFIGKRFTAITGVSITISAVGMILMDYFADYFPTYENGEAIFAAIIAGVLGGIGFAMMIRIGGSTGGTDIFAILMQKKHPEAKLSWLAYAFNSAIVFSSIFVFKGEGALSFMTPVMMSLTEQFSYAMVSDVILTGEKSALKFEIITNRPEEFSQELITKLHRGVTSIQAKGMYSHDEHTMLICVIRKRQLGEFNNILKKFPDTFAYVVNTREVIGRFLK